MDIRLFQINTERDAENVCYTPFKNLPEQAVDASIYDLGSYPSVIRAKTQILHHKYSPWLDGQYTSLLEMAFTMCWKPVVKWALSMNKVLDKSHNHSIMEEMAHIR